jgi:predicted DNA-binding antitoxin AbrB/MazE fold protein
MVRHIDAIYSMGALRPVEPLVLPEGARVRISVEDEADMALSSKPMVIRTPKLAHKEDVGDFAMEVREIGNAGV